VPERNTILPGGGFFTSRAMKFSPITTRVVLKKSENPTEIFEHGWDRHDRSDFKTETVSQTEFSKDI